jgi:hypothetical protein
MVTKKGESKQESPKKTKSIKLPKPKFTRGKSLFQSLQQRKTTREIRGKKLPLQVLSNLLWAACGINRKKVAIGKYGRTSGSASNSQEIDVYIVMKEGAFLFDSFRHKLDPVVTDDLRIFALNKGQRDMGSDAPLHLVYVVDINKLANTSGYREPGLLDPEIQKSYYYVDTGLIAGNVYLFAASTGLASWFHNCDKENLAKKLKLRSDQRVLFGQTIGYAVRT